MFKPEPTAKVVFIVIRKDLSCGVLDNYPHPTPRFDIRRLDYGRSVEWKVDLEFDSDLGFTENMTSRTDVLQYLLVAPRHIDVSCASSVIESVSKVLLRWAELFPKGVPDSIEQDVQHF